MSLPPVAIADSTFDVISRSSHTPAPGYFGSAAQSIT